MAALLAQMITLAGTELTVSKNFSLPIVAALCILLSMHLKTYLPVMAPMMPTPATFDVTLTSLIVCSCYLSNSVPSAAIF